MWTATYTKVQKKETTITVEVTYFKDGVSQAIVSFPNVDISTIKTRVISKLKELQMIDNLDVSALTGDVDLTEAVPATEEPTKEEVEKQKYFSLLDKWTVAKQDYDRGLLSDVLFNQIDLDLKLQYKPEYSGIV